MQDTSASADMEKTPLPVNEVCPEVYAVAVYHKAKGRRAREKLPCVAQHTAGGSPVVRPYLGVREGEAKGC